MAPEISKGLILGFQSPISSVKSSTPPKYGMGLLMHLIVLSSLSD